VEVAVAVEVAEASVDATATDSVDVEEADSVDVAGALTMAIPEDAGEEVAHSTAEKILDPSAAEEDMEDVDQQHQMIAGRLLFPSSIRL
jgi:hypothetical protein